MADVLDVSFQTSGPRVNLDKLTVIQKFGHHTLALLDYQITEKREYVLPKENTPIKVRWGVSPVGVGTYYGYVNHYESANKETDTHTRLVSVGTSKKMNAAVPSTWHNTTRSSIVRDIARRYKMRSITHANDWVVDHWSTGPRSDWEALNALAEESGYYLWVDGPTLHFLDPRKVVMSSDAMTVARFQNESVESFEVLGGSNIPGAIQRSRRRVLYGLDYSTNDLFVATSGNVKNQEEMIPLTVNTYSEAERYTDSAARREGDYFYARARVTGDATLYPGRVVRFDLNDVGNDHNGIWTVTEATHVVSSDSGFTTTLVMTRGEDPIHLNRVVTTVRGSSGAVEAVVRDGESWEATLQEHVNV